jgi:FMN phosphatase YigB (HAD superfamily)
MIQAIFFDLDNCLSAADEVGAGLLEPVFEAVKNANAGALSNEVMRAAFHACWRFPFDDVARRFGFSDRMRDAGFRAFVDIQIAGSMRGYSDLATLDALPVKRFLVTSGFRRLQESKVRALGIASSFEAIYIDDIDQALPRGKEAIFREIVERYALRTPEVLVVGDNSDSEIAAGNRLGLTTVQILRPGVPRGDNADYVIEGLAELASLVKRLSESRENAE